MGQQHNELRRGNLSAALSNAIGDTRGGGLECYGETLTPVVDLWRRPEWALLREEHLWGAREQPAPGAAGTFVKVGIFNPAGSELIVVVTDHWLSVDAATDVELSPQDTFLGNGGTVVMRDRRQPLFNGGTTQFVASAGVGADVFLTVTVPTAPSLHVPLAIVLPPGRGFMWRTLDDAAVLAASFAGYSRRAFSGELV